MRQSRWRVARDYREVEEYQKEWKISSFVSEKITPWLENVLSKSGAKVTIKRIGAEIDEETGAIKFLPEYKGKRLTIEPDFKLTYSNGKETELEFQYSKELRKTYDFKQNKVRRANAEGVKFLYLVKPTNEWAILDPVDIERKGRIVVVTAWGGKEAYRVEHAEMGFSVDPNLDRIWKEVNEYIESLDLSSLGKLEVNCKIWEAILRNREHDAGFCDGKGSKPTLTATLHSLRILRLLKSDSIKLIGSMSIDDNDKKLVADILIDELMEVDCESMLERLTEKGRAIISTFVQLDLPRIKGIVDWINSFQENDIFVEPEQDVKISTISAILSLSLLNSVPRDSELVLQKVQKLAREEKDLHLRNMLIAAAQELLTLLGRLY